MFLLRDRDLNFRGFDALAHPLNGLMTTEFRPVDCVTKQPLHFLPGFTNETVYGDCLEAGWSWFPYKQSFSSFWAPVSTGNTCISCVLALLGVKCALPRWTLLVGLAYMAWQEKLCSR
jgi:hypothetical protein